MTTVTMVDTSTSAPLSATGDDISAAAVEVSAPLARVSGAESKGARRLSVLFWVIAALGGVILAGVGFAGSYSALKHLAEVHQFKWFSPYFPIGVDVGIVVLYVLDLALIRRHTPWPLLRSAAHLFTLATIYFNAESAGPIHKDPKGAAMHAIIPLCFILTVEAVRRLLSRWAQIEAGKESPHVPLYRWVLAPWPTWMLFRRMKLWELPSYEAAVRMEQQRTVYRVMLEREYGPKWRQLAPADERLPILMERFGLTVEAALQLPAEQAAAAAARAQAKQARQLQQQAAEAEMHADAEIAAMQSKNKVTAARVAVDTAAQVALAEGEAATLAARGQVDVQKFRTDAERVTAERAQQRAARIVADEEDAQQSEAAAETRRAAAEKDQAAAEMEHTTAETRRIAAENRQKAQQADLDAATAKRKAAEERRQEAAAEAAAAEITLGVAEIKARAREVELREVEAEDLAKLTPRQRTVRRVARMILAQGGTPEAIPLRAIEEEFGVANGTASEYRAEAAELLDQGYQPLAIETARPAASVIPQPYRNRDERLSA